jgi:hypothetical protein
VAYSSSVNTIRTSAAVYVWASYQEDQAALRHKITYNSHPRINVAKWAPGVCYWTTRFWPNKIVQLYELLGLPETITLDNSCVESGLTSLSMSKAIKH